ncbi:MAG: CPBP family intramembrane metalloprotease [Bacteroidia bacterium]|nr:CPBP family intramembrane metalloprotease [Bacteroidia bacterium]
MRAYWKASLAPAYNFFISVALLVGYEGLIWLTNASHRNLADEWLSRILVWAHPYEWAVSLGMVLVGLAYVYGIRKDKGSLESWVFGLMLVEAALWAIAIFKLLPLLSGYLRLHMQLNWLSREFWEAIAQCLGAGFYEELLFRVLIVEALLLIFSGIALKKNLPAHYVLAWMLSAMVFSALHFLYEPPTRYAFAYRMLFGLVMSGLYMLRGFGITAWTHALYDMYVLWWG